MRAAEALVKKERPEEGQPHKPQRQSAEKDADTRALEGDLSATLGMKVTIDHKPGQEGGQVTVTYKNLEELDDLCRVLGGS